MSGLDELPVDGLILPQPLLGWAGTLPPVVPLPAAPALDPPPVPPACPAVPPLDAPAEGAPARFSTGLLPPAPAAEPSEPPAAGAPAELAPELEGEPAEGAPAEVVGAPPFAAPPAGGSALDELAPQAKSAEQQLNTPMLAAARDTLREIRRAATEEEGMKVLIN